MFTIGIRNLVCDFRYVQKSILIDEGLHTLKQRLGVSLGAIHNSAKRFPPPNCRSETRMVVRQIILGWIHSESSEKFLIFVFFDSLLETDQYMTDAAAPY